MMPQYPIVLADWEFQGEHWQMWNMNEGMWLVRAKTHVDDMLGPWELVIQV